MKFKLLQIFFNFIDYWIVDGESLKKFYVTRHYIKKASSYQIAVDNTIFISQNINLI